MEHKIPHVHFGNSEKKVTLVGLGGEGVLRTSGLKDQAEAVIDTAVRQGIGYFDSARVYSDSELYYGSYWNKNPDRRKQIFHTSKSANRSREGALADLQQSLGRLHTDYLDLWQIHDIRTEDDLNRISEKDGALEAFLEAKEMGLVNHIGVTGHHDPNILTRAVNEWPVDSVLLPVNPVEDIIGGFMTETLEAAYKKGIAVIGMKVLGGGHYMSDDAGITPDLLIRYALSFNITTAIIGCSTGEEVNTLINAGCSRISLSSGERNDIKKLYKPVAQKLAYYRGKSSLKV